MIGQFSLFLSNDGCKGIALCPYLVNKKLPRYTIIFELYFYSLKLSHLRESMASSLRVMPSLKSIFDSVGTKAQFLSKYRLERERFVFAEGTDDSSSLSSESDESDEEELEESVLLAHLEVETVSLILKLWLRRIQLTEQDQRKKLEDFEHEIYKIQERVIKPYKSFLISNKSKDPEEIQMFHHYRERLEEACCTLCKEKVDISFDMAKEDDERLTMEEVFICSLLGLKLDFLDRLIEMPSEIRHHRTLCDWIVMFLRNNFNSFSLREKNRLNKDLLYEMGFDSMSSSVETILTRVGNMAEHIEACEWAEIFIKDEFKYNPLLSQQSPFSRFPFQSNKRNEWFEWNDDNDECPVNVVNLVTTKNEISGTTRSLMGKFQLEDPQHTVLYHGTDYASARDILTGRGIYLWAGRQKRDFSNRAGFYLTNNLDEALNWALSTTAKPAILVFRVNHSLINREARRLTMNSGDETWREIVTSFRLNKETAKTKRTLSVFDVIEGPVAKVSREDSGSSNGGELVFEPKPYSYQMCLISEDFAETFENTLHSIFFYDIS